MTPPPDGNPVPDDRVEALFDRIAPVYDAMNALMTVGIDRRWRSSAVRAARLTPGMRALDVACGTGALTRALAAAVTPGGEVVGVDRSAPMLAHARRAPTRGMVKPRYLLADALTLPMGPDGFDAVTIAFGLRNLADYAGGLIEMVRVARPGGRVVVLEIAEPEGGVGRLLYRTWFRRVVPLLGRLAGRGAAYRYLPASVEGYPSPKAVAGLMLRAGLVRVRWRRLASGMATLHLGIKPGGEGTG